MEYKSLGDRVSTAVQAVYEKHAVELRPLWKKYVKLYKKIFYKILDLNVEKDMDIAYVNTTIYRIYDIILDILINGKQYILDTVNRDIDYINCQLKNSNIDFTLTIDNWDEFIRIDLNRKYVTNWQYAIINSIKIFENDEIMTYLHRLVELNKALCAELQGLDKDIPLRGIILYDIKTDSAYFYIEYVVGHDTPRSIMQFVKYIAEDFDEKDIDYINVKI